MSESAKEVFARIPEARRDTALREADTSTINVYRDAVHSGSGTPSERRDATSAAEDAARAAVFARFVEPVAPSSSAFERIPEHRRYAALRDADHNTKEAYGIAANVCNGTAVEKAAAGLAAEMAAREAVFKRHAEMAATPFASSHGIFLRIPKANRDAARAEANEAGNKAWSKTYDVTNCDCDAAAKAEEVARAAVFTRYVARFAGVTPSVEAVRESLSRIPKERQGEAMRLADAETADVYRDAFSAASGDDAAKNHAACAIERAARCAVYRKFAATTITDGASGDRFAIIQESHRCATLLDNATPGAHADRGWLISEVKRLREAFARAVRVNGVLKRNFDAQSAELAAAHETSAAGWARVEANAKELLVSGAERTRLTDENARLHAALGAIADAQPSPFASSPFDHSPDAECECATFGVRETAADHDDACSLHPLHGAKPSDAWPRVVFVEPFGYDRDDHLNPTFSGQISGAKRFSDTEAQKRASQLRVAGYQKVRVIRLRPRAK